MKLNSLFCFFIASIFIAGCGDQSRQSVLDHDNPSLDLRNNIEEFNFDTAVKAVSNDKIFDVFLNWVKGPAAGPNKENIADIFISVKDHSKFEVVRFQPKMTCCGTEPPQKQNRSIVENEPSRMFVKNIYFHAAGPKKSWKLFVDLKINGKTDRAEIILDEVK